MKRVLLTLLTATALLSAAPEGEIQKRKENQQKRIGEGVENGSLTAGEAARLEKKEAKLNRQIHRERKANGGNLTNKEKAQVNREQNRLSKDIYKEKHDAQTQPK